MSSGYLFVMPFLESVWEILSPVTSRASGTACWSRRIVPIIAVECPSRARLTISSSTSVLSEADHPGASLTPGLLEPLRPLPPLCMRDMSVTSGVRATCSPSLIAA